MRDPAISVSGETAAASGALGRLLSREEQISDVVAFLSALDPEPLLRALGIQAGNLRVRREQALGGSAGRADLVLLDDGRPIALVEIKAAAAQHGDQFARYDRWARAQVPEVRCFLITVNGGLSGTPDGWVTDLSLPALLRHWQSSPHPHASWLASAAAGVLETWITEVNGKVGQATNPIVSDLAARRIAADLTAIAWLGKLGLDARALRTSGGTASVVAWLPYPGKPSDDNAWLCADFRSLSRNDLRRPWVLRLGVEVGGSDQQAAAQARATAHDLATGIAGSLTCSALRQAVRQAGHEELASALRPRHGSQDGLRGGTDEAGIAEWRSVTLTTGESDRHPLLFHDNLYAGIRLASAIEVNVTELDRHHLTRLLVIALSHLNHACQR